MLWNYIKDIASKTSTKIFTCFDVIFYIFGLLNYDIKVPPYIYGVIFIIGFIWGNFDIYKEYKAIANHEQNFCISFATPTQCDTKTLIINIKKVDEKSINKIVEDKRNSLIKKHNDYLSGNQQNNLQSGFIKVFFENNRNYDEELTQYLDDLKEYLIYKSKLENYLIKFSPMIINEGNMNSMNNRIEFNFSNEFYFPSEKDYLFCENPNYFPEIPEEPNLNISRLEQIGLSPVSGYINTPPINGNLVKSNISGPFYINSLVFYEITNIVPGLLIQEMNPFFIWFDKLGIFEKQFIETKIYSSDLPKPQVQKISLKISIQES